MGVLRPAGDFDRTYEQDMAIIRKPWQWVLLALSILFVLILPRVGSGQTVALMNRITYTIIALQGLNILTGYSGQISLGQAAFMLVGGYVSAVTMTHLNFPIFLSIPAAALGAGIVGLIFAIPSLRVKGFYLAMATLAAQFIIPWLSRQVAPDYLGGTNGFIEVPVVSVFGFTLEEPSNYVYLSMFVLLITTILTANLTRTKLGRAFVSIRDNDLAAELLGVNLFTYKLRAFFYAAVLAGVAGALKAHFERAVGTEMGYTLNDSVLFLGMLVIGGLGTNIGPFLGGIFVIVLNQYALNMGGFVSDMFPEQAAQLGTSFRPIFFGLVLVLFLIFEPRGMAHRWNVSKAAWRLRPFAR